jgi:acyl CoA:acetate/3-ketoacid CoA transferase beta subunit
MNTRLVGLDRDSIARLAADIPPRSSVNLGIGLPTTVANFLARTAA